MAQAYGSITIVDISDLGQLSVVPESNQPAMVIYDPDENKYTPNWTDTGGLTLTPVIYLGSKNLVYPEVNDVVWTKKIGAGTEVPVTPGLETNDRNVLKVPKNIFSLDPENLVEMVTYIVTVTYVEPNTKQSLRARGQITFSLIKNASRVKSVRITGGSAFLYNADGKIPADKPSSITLTAAASNVSIQKWTYKNSVGVYEDIPGSAGKSEITILHSDPYFFADFATIKVITSDKTVTDEHTIVKIRNGANGNSTVSAVLSNEDQLIPCDSSGNPTSFAGADTKLTIYEGTKEVTSSWQVSITTSEVTGTAAPNNHGYTVNGLTADTGYVLFTCKRSGYDTFYKKFSLVKVKTGVDGITPEVRTLQVSTLAINAAVNDMGQITTYTPNAITITSLSLKGDSGKVQKAARFQIFVDDQSKPAYTSSSDEAQKVWNLPSRAIKRKLTVKMFEAGSTSTLLDSQTIIVTVDGRKGEPGGQGDAGKDSINFVLGNQSDVIPCSHSGLVIGPLAIKIPCSAYVGIEKKPCYAKVLSSLPSGMSADASQPNLITINVANQAPLDNADTGEIVFQLSLSASDTKNSSQLTYRWTKNKKALDGQNGENGTNAILFQIYAPGGNIISNGENNVVLQTNLVDGATIKTASSYQWSKFSNGQYSPISSANAASYTVKPSDVNGYASYQCIARYDGKDYKAYFSVYDRTDPLQVTIISTIGDKIINSTGAGILYADVFRSGQRIDEIKTLNWGDSSHYPGAPRKGEFFYLVDGEAKNRTLTLQQYNGQRWSNVAETTAYRGRYKWSLRDKKNQVISKTFTTKAIYVDADVIDERTTFDVEVEL